MTPGALDGRSAAYLATLDALTGRGFAVERLRGLREAGRLEGREAGLAREVALGALRHALTIDQLLVAVARYQRQRVGAALRAALYTGAYQLVWLERVPAFAAVDQAVAAARRRVSRRAAGMVNAVLRRLAAAIEARRVPWQRLDRRQVRVSWDQACAFVAPVLPEPDPSDGCVEHLAAATGERVERYRRLVERFGCRRAEAVAWASQALPVITLQRQTLRVNSGVFQQQVRQSCGAAAVCTPDAAFLPAWARVGELALLREGRAYVQDVTGHAAASLVRARPGERVLDLCAAPGGKSAALAQQMQDRGELLACDASAARLAQLRANACRLGLTCIRTHLRPAGEGSGADLPGVFDAALVDAPCSNTGVIARRPEARLGLTVRKLASLAGLQARLLRCAAGRVRPGGRVVYSTCSIEPQENEEVVAAFLAEHDDWRLELARNWLPSWGPKLSDWRDGGYAAALVRGR